MSSTLSTLLHTQRPFLGYGLGLRKEHYTRVLDELAKVRDIAERQLCGQPPC